MVRLLRNNMNSIKKKIIFFVATIALLALPGWASAESATNDANMDNCSKDYSYFICQNSTTKQCVTFPKGSLPTGITNPALYCSAARSNTLLGCNAGGNTQNIGCASSLTTGPENFGCCMATAKDDTVTCTDLASNFQNDACSTASLISDTSLISKIFGIPGANNIAQFESSRGSCSTVKGCPQFTGNPLTGTTDILKDLQVKKPILEIGLPQLSFTDVKNTLDAEGYIHLPWIGEYISAAYKFAMGIGSIVAIVMIIVQGGRVITSGGGEEKVAAYKRIGQIVVGLGIMWGSYAILFNINPDLVSFKALKVKYIEPVPFEDPHEDEVAEEAKPAAPVKTIPGACDSLKTLTAGEKGRDFVDMQTFMGKLDLCTVKTRPAGSVQKIVIHNGGFTANGNQETWYKSCLYKKSPDVIPDKEKYDKKGELKKYSLVGAHYTIDRGGTIYQHVAEGCVVYHAPGGNDAGIGIELNISKDENGRSCNSLVKPSAKDVHTACDPTQAQYDSLKKLIDDIHTRHSIPLNINTVKGHCELVGPSGHGDPRAFDWTQLKLGFTNEEKKSVAGGACSWYLPF